MYVGYTRVAPAAWGGDAMACSDDSAAFIAAMGRLHQGGECRLCPADAVDAHPVAFERHLLVVDPRAVALQQRCLLAVEDARTRDATDGRDTRGQGVDQHVEFGREDVGDKRMARRGSRVVRRKTRKPNDDDHALHILTPRPPPRQTRTDS